MLLPAQGMPWARCFLPVSQQCGFQHFQGHCANSPPVSRVAFCILSTSGESDVKYSACLPLLHCELSGIKAAQNAVKCILEQHGQESLDSVEYQNQLHFLMPSGFQYWEIIPFSPSELNSPLCAIRSGTHVILLRPHTRWSTRILCDITDPRDDSNSLVCIYPLPQLLSSTSTSLCH